MSRLEDKLETTQRGHGTEAQSTLERLRNDYGAWLKVTGEHGGTPWEVEVDTGAFIHRWSYRGGAGKSALFGLDESRRKT